MRKLAFLIALIALPLHADLRSTITAQNGWVAYSIPAMDDRNIWCGYDGDVRAASEIHIQYEVTDHQITAIRLSSPYCADVKVARFLGPANVQESVQLLTNLIDHDTSSVAKKATDALAMHPDVDETLVRLARSHPSGKVRSTALFWVGQHAGKKAASTLKDAVDNDPDAEVRSKAVFAISQLPDDRSIPLLVELMTTHKNAAVRKKAAFWLGQKNDPRALEALERILLK